MNVQIEKASCPSNVAHVEQAAKQPSSEVAAHP
jgi:hypothetical protein